MKRMVLGLLVLAAMLGGARAEGEAPAGEVGLDEKLGQKALLSTLLRDETGAEVRFGTLVDRPTILTLNYFRCAGICTPLLNGVVEALNRIELQPGRDFRVITVSFDERDTPEIAARKKTNYLREVTRPFPPSAWRFLTGDAASTKALADSVGFRFLRQGDDFVHPGVVVVLSPDGVVTRYLFGVSFLPFDLQMAIGEASKGIARPTISKILQYCYSYDPVGRRYAVDVVRISGTVVLSLAALFAVALLVLGRKKPTEGTR